MTKGIILVFALSLATGAATARAQQITISDTRQQSNFNGYTQGTDPTHNTAPITSNPFNFTGQQMLSSITSITITLTIFDGDTGLGPNGTNDTPFPPDGMTHGDDDDFVNTLHLRLAGFDAGQSFFLNGFDNYDQAGGEPIPQGFITRTLTGLPANTAGILSALQGGTINALIFDAGFSNQANNSQNAFVVPSTLYQSSTQIFATLSITGQAIPEPASVAFFAFGLSLLLLTLPGNRRRFSSRLRKVIRVS